jgi:shikimate 5-dehydrogenase
LTHKDAKSGKNNYDLVIQGRPTMYFFGVTTGKSASREMFPLWAQILELGDAQLVGVDIPIGAPLQAYRKAVTQIKNDRLSLGALVTTHKIDTLRAARDLFDELTEDTVLTQEISCIYQRAGRTIAHAVDPQTCGQAMAQFIEAGYWRTSRAEVMCIGAGGSARALAAYFIKYSDRNDRPKRIVIVDLDQDKLEQLRSMVERLPGSGIQFEYSLNSAPKVNNELMSSLPPGSMVVNATGMGKDIPGSPVSDEGAFPEHGIAWELNYRGELDFKRQAQAQAQQRNLRVEDGWDYFLIGWAEIMGLVFDVEITAAQWEQMKRAAELIR